ncbi:hypothetical protein Mpsy_0806 [Methanolobus psychrophilus R15]|nr:hypothetical protein Mpsy_0806 [Methanolobus psychrophilus R15]
MSMNPTGGTFTLPGAWAEIKEHRISKNFFYGFPSFSG